MSTRAARRRNTRLGTGVLALALLAPVGEPAIANATDTGEEQESETEGGSEADPNGDQGEGAGDLTPGQDTTGDLTDENSLALSSPADPANPEDGEDENGPVETAPPPEPTDEIPAAGPQPPPPTPPAPAPTRTAPSPAAPVTPSDGPVATTAPSPRKRVAPVRRRHEATARSESKRARPADPPRRPPAPVRAPSAAASDAPSAGATTPARAPAPAARTQGTHMVQPGETLWSIASARLGPGASAAQIAREVQRIWDLNARAIGTGDPSLIGVGIQLRFG